MAMPDLTEIRNWCQVDSGQLDDDQLSRIISAETLNQARVCRVPFDEYPDDLAQALLRRVARAAALRGIPLGVISGIADGQAGVTRVSGLDREIQRLEKPFRKLASG